VFEDRSDEPITALWNGRNVFGVCGVVAESSPDRRHSLNEAVIGRERARPYLLEKVGLLYYPMPISDENQQKVKDLRTQQNRLIVAKKLMDGGIEPERPEHVLACTR
jgi:hypothetical protein